MSSCSSSQLGIWDRPSSSALPQRSPLSPPACGCITITGQRAKLCKEPVDKTPRSAGLRHFCELRGVCGVRAPSIATAKVGRVAPRAPWIDAWVGLAKDIHRQKRKSACFPSACLIPAARAERAPYLVYVGSKRAWPLPRNSTPRTFSPPLVPPILVPFPNRRFNLLFSALFACSTPGRQSPRPP